METRPQSWLPHAGTPHSAAWTEILTATSHSYARLARAVASREAARHGVRLLEELENERARTARDLHSGAGQPLAGIRLNVELFNEWAETMPEPARVALGRITSLTDAALEQVRALSHRLHPPLWQQLSLPDALRGLITASALEMRFPETRIGLAELSGEPSHSTKVALYRCAQECISNAIRHSEASSFSLELSETGGQLELRIADNGRGMTGTVEDGGGIGLRAIRYHAQAAGGTCRILTTAQPAEEGENHGTTIIVRIPLTP